MLLRPLRRLQPLRHPLHPNPNPNPNPNPFVATSIAELKHSFSASSSSASFVDLPKPRRSWERKPLVTPITELKRRRGRSGGRGARCARLRSAPQRTASSSKP
uniref:Uncharacterized protein n=1 Tax=Ananas comosus var. bracteatus TaxID=296719 RepID=A0A6V7PIZ3_ANACO|nr:unnamed protein product [Ananas comosus var. bracteatus]